MRDVNDNMNEYALEGQRILPPTDPRAIPSGKHLDYHGHQILRTIPFRSEVHAPSSLLAEVSNA